MTHFTVAQNEDDQRVWIRAYEGAIMLDFTITHADGQTNIKAPSGYRWLVKPWGNSVKVSLRYMRFLAAFVSGPVMGGKYLYAYMEGFGGRYVHSYMLGKGGRFVSAYMNGKGGKYLPAFMTAKGGRFLGAYTRCPYKYHLRNGSNKNIEVGGDKRRAANSITKSTFVDSFSYNTYGGNGQGFGTCCANDRYIWYCFWSGSSDNLNFYVKEYNIETKETKVIPVSLGSENDSTFDTMCFIKDRKLLVSAMSSANNWGQYAWIVDFETETCTQTLQVTGDYAWIDTVMAIERDGDIWLFVWSLDSNTSYLYYQIWGDEGWEYASATAPYSDYTYPIFVGEDYIAAFFESTDYSTHAYLDALVFNIQTHTFSATNQLSFVPSPTGINRFHKSQPAPDFFATKAYCCCVGTTQWYFPPYQWFWFWAELDPTTATLTMIDSGNESTQAGEDWSYAFSDRLHAYIMKYEGTIYDPCGSGSWSTPGSYPSTQLADDDGTGYFAGSSDYTHIHAVNRYWDKEITSSSYSSAVDHLTGALLHYYAYSTGTYPNQYLYSYLYLLD